MLRSYFLLLTMASLCAAHAQMVIEDGTSLHVEAASSLRIETPLTWSLPTGSVVVNDGDIILGAGARLEEAVGAAITGNGTERITRDLSTPVTAEDPGGLGGIITTEIALGNTLVVRGHLPYTDYSGHTSIARWIDLTPATNSGLDAQLSFRYDPAELNGVAETDQRLHVNTSTGLWWFLASDVNTGERTVSTAGLDSLGLFTTFNEDLPNSIVPVVHGTAFALLGAPGSPLYLSVPANERAETLEVYAANGALLRAVSPRWATGVHALPISGTSAGLYRLRVNGRHNFTFLMP